MRRWSLSLWILTVLTSAAAGADAVARVPKVPTNPGAWWTICTMPDLGDLAGPNPKKQHIVDHGLIQDATGKWQLWACLRGTAVSRLIYGWEGSSLDRGPWQATGVKVRADPAFGEQIKNGQETAGAPYFFKIGDVYHCLYHSAGFRLMTSKDGVHYQRAKLEDGTNRTGIPGGRDVTLLRHGDTWYSYATVTDFEPGKPKTRENLTSWIVAATSKDFKTWTGNHIVSKGGKPGSGPVDSESPFVIYLDGYFYLFRASSITFKTYVYRSTDPLNFGIDDDSKLIAEFKIKAPELIHHEGQWYISDLHDFQGIRMTKVEWVEAGG